MNIYLNWLALFCALCVAGLHSVRCITIIQQKNYRPEKNSAKIRKERALYFYKCLLAGCILAAIAYYELWISVGIFTPLFSACLIVSLVKAIKNTKVPLKCTRRVKRLFAVYLIVFSGCLYFAYLLYFTAYLIFAAFLLVALNAVFLDGLNAVVSVFENLNNRRYINAAKKRLASSSVYKIGITGSYGKTSTKNILAKMLARKYKVLCTPENYNTPLGISLTLKDKDLNAYDVFVAEMGARHKGDIKQLADMVRPAASVITGVGPQHLATFKSVKNIVREKGRLAEKTKEYCVIDISNPYGQEIYSKTACSKIAVCASQYNKAQVYAEHISFDNNLTRFDIVFIDGVTLKDCATVLLGAHNITNILLAAAMALFLGVKAGEIREAIASLTPMPHRLELVQNTRGITIIDDTYNANFEGVKSAYKVLQGFSGRKVVLTQGIAELGKKSAELNYQTGRLLAQVADLVLLTGVNAPHIEKGLLNSGFDKTAIKHYASLAAAQSDFERVLQKGDIFLLQNDLIDIS